MTSMLIEPVFRQARRFSRQTSHRSSPSDISEESSDAQSKRSSARSNGDRSTLTSDQENNNCFRPGLRAGLSGSAAHRPSIFPTLALEMAGHARDEFKTPSQPRQEEYEPNCSSREPFLETLDAFDTHSHYRSEPGPARVVDSDVGPTISRDTRPADSSSEPNDSLETPPSTQESERSPANTFEMDYVGQSILPEDDGMGVLREKIHAIREKDVSSTEKARMIHELMTESYNSSRGRVSNVQTLSPTSPPSCPQNHAHPTRPISPASEPSIVQFPTESFSTVSVNKSASNFYLTPEDLQPTFAPRDEQEADSLLEGEDMDTEELEESCFGCQHYKRNVKLQCFTCKKWYTCRFCHDEFEDHHLVRKMTENMLCMFCGHAQPASQWCKECGGQAAQYYCHACKLWDNDSKKSIYHCPDCGICRIGQGLGKDFFHCKVKWQRREKENCVGSAWVC